MNELNILYATDTNYSQHAAASIYSLLKNNSCFEKINIYIIDDNISDECKEKFYTLNKEFPNSQIIFYPFKELSKKLELNDKTGFAQVGYAAEIRPTKKITPTTGPSVRATVGKILSASILPAAVVTA